MRPWRNRFISMMECTGDNPGNQGVILAPVMLIRSWGKVDRLAASANAIGWDQSGGGDEVEVIKGTDIAVGV